MIAVAVEVEPVTDAHTHAPVAAIQGKEVEAGLCLVHVVRRSPSYRLKVKGGQVMADDELGEARAVDNEKITKPQWKWDRHNIFHQIAANDREITALGELYSVADALPGDRMMSMIKVPQFLVQLNGLIAERKELVEKLKEIWYSEVIPDLTAFFGEHFYQIRPLLPAMDHTLWSRYEILPIMRPLTPISTDEFDLSSLSAEDKQSLVTGQRDMIQKLFKDRFTSLFDTVFGEVYNACLDITQGPKDPDTGIRSGKSSLEGGRKKTGTLSEIIKLLDRVANFSQFTSPEVMAAVTEARSMLANTSVQSLNQDDGDNLTTQAIKSVMSPLGNMVKALWEKHTGRAVRTVTM